MDVFFVVFCVEISSGRRGLYILNTIVLEDGVDFWFGSCREAPVAACSTAFCRLGHEGRAGDVVVIVPVNDFGLFWWLRRLLLLLLLLFGRCCSVAGMIELVVTTHSHGRPSVQVCIIHGRQRVGHNFGARIMGWMELRRLYVCYYCLADGVNTDRPLVSAVLVLCSKWPWQPEPFPGSLEI